MAPHEDKSWHDVLLDLRNHVHLDGYGRLAKRKIKPVARDRQGFRKRRPKLVVALGLGIVAVLTAAIRVIIKNADRG